MVNSVVNKVEMRLPAKNNAEIFSAFEEIMDNAREVIRHADVRKFVRKELGGRVFCHS